MVVSRTHVTKKFAISFELKQPRHYPQTSARCGVRFKLGRAKTTSQHLDASQNLPSAPMQLTRSLLVLSSLAACSAFRAAAPQPPLRAASTRVNSRAVTPLMDFVRRRESITL